MFPNRDGPARPIAPPPSLSHSPSHSGSRSRAAGAPSNARRVPSTRETGRGSRGLRRSHTTATRSSTGTPAWASYPTPRAARAIDGTCRGRFASSVLFLARALPLGSPALLLGSSALRQQLSLCCLVLYLLQVLRRAFPVGVEYQALIVLGLGEDARPGVQQSGCRVDRAGDGLAAGQRRSGQHWRMRGRATRPDEP